MRPWLPAGLVMILMAVAPAPAPAAGYRVVPLGVIEACCDLPSATLNNHGAVAGTGEDRGEFGPFLWQDGTLTRLLPWTRQGFSICSAVDVNGRGEVLASGACDPGDGHNAWVFGAGGMQAYDLPDVPANVDVKAFNNAGQVAGRLECFGGAPGCSSGPVLWTLADGTLTLITPLLSHPGLGFFRAVDTPGADKVTGTGARGDQVRPFWYSHGRASWLPIPRGFDIGEAVAANAAGAVVGSLFRFADLDPEPPFPAIWADGRVTLIDDGSGFFVGFPTGVNRHRTVVGLELVDDIVLGELRAFVARDGGRARDLDALAGRPVWPHAINAAGTILVRDRATGELLLLKPRR